MTVFGSKRRVAAYSMVAVEESKEKLFEIRGAVASAIGKAKHRPVLIIITKIEGRNKRNREAGVVAEANGRLSIEAFRQLYLHHAKGRVVTQLLPMVLYIGLEGIFLVYLYAKKEVKAVLPGRQAISATEKNQ